MNAANLKVAEIYIAALANLAKTNNTLIVPANVADVATMIGTAMNTLSTVKPGGAQKGGA
jgi:ribosomal protein L18E